MKFLLSAFRISTFAFLLSAFRISTFAFLLSAFSISALSQTNYYGVYSASNGVILPGYYLPANQLQGAFTNVPNLTNYATLAQYGALTNQIATNLTRPGLIVSNSASTNIGSVLITNGTVTASGAVAAAAIQSQNFSFNTNFGLIGPGDFDVGGTNNYLSTSTGLPFGDNSGFVGGQFNQLLTAQAGVIAGGWYNIISYSAFSFIGGGISNTITQSGSANAIAGGRFNLIYYGSNNVIAGGWGNNIKSTAYGAPAGCVILGGIGNSITGVSNSIAGGIGATAAHSGVFIFSDTPGFTSTAPGQVLFHATNGVGINTNNPGTNALAVNGNVDAPSYTCQGTNLFAAFTGLSAAWQYNLTLTSNALAAATLTLFNQFAPDSNSIVVTSNALSLAIAAVFTSCSNLVQTASNGLAAQINLTAMKALTATLPANYASIGIGFSTPLMSDGNYSVVLTPSDQTTADAQTAGLHAWVDTKNNSGFTLHTDYATNAYNLNYECIVKENSQ